MRKRFTWSPIVLLYLAKRIVRFKKRYDLFYRARAPVLSFAKIYHHHKPFLKPKKTYYEKVINLCYPYRLF